MSNLLSEERKISNFHGRLHNHWWLYQRTYADPYQSTIKVLKRTLNIDLRSVDEFPTGRLCSTCYNGVWFPVKEKASIHYLPKLQIHLEPRRHCG